MPAWCSRSSSTVWMPADSSTITGTVSSLSARSGSAEVPTTATWSVCSAGAGKAPSPNTSATSRRRQASTTSSQNARQRKSGSGPTSSSASRSPLGRGHQQLGRRPGHLLDGAAGQPDHRPPGPVVDQLVGVEGGQGGGVPARAQEHGRGLAGQPGVGPAVQMDDQERVAEPREVGEVEQLAHARQGSRFRPGAATVRPPRTETRRTCRSTPNPPGQVETERATYLRRRPSRGPAEPSAGKVMEMRRVVVMTVLVTLATLLVTVPRGRRGRPSRSGPGEAARIDFNGDGFDDLAVGAPGRRSAAPSGAGAVNVLYGSADGLVPSADVFFQGSGGVGGTAESGDGFGVAVAQGTVQRRRASSTWPSGSPARRTAAPAPAGRSTSSTAPPAASPAGPLFVQATPERNDRFGASLAAGDFNGDELLRPGRRRPGRGHRRHRRRRGRHRPVRLGGRHHHRRRPDPVPGQRRGRRVGRGTRRLRGVRWPPGSWPTTTSPTWSSGCPARTSAASARPGR